MTQLKPVDYLSKILLEGPVDYLPKTPLEGIITNINIFEMIEYYLFN